MASLQFPIRLRLFVPEEEESRACQICLQGGTEYMVNKGSITDTSFQRRLHVQARLGGLRDGRKGRSSVGFLSSMLTRSV